MIFGVIATTKAGNHKLFRGRNRLFCLGSMANNTPGVKLFSISHKPLPMTNAWKGLTKICAIALQRQQRLDKIGGGADIIVAYLQLRLVCVRSPFSFPGRRAIDSLYKSIKGSSIAICR
jgi:hypothetical protein